MTVDWYNKIALRNDGYKSAAKYALEGKSGEVVFEKLLKGTVGNYSNVLDMGCGHGAFTLEIAKYCKKITGADNAEELLKIAYKLKEKSNQSNAEFVYASTKGKFPLKENEYDLIYVRRGPTSIVENAHILKSGGKLMGVYTHDLDIEGFVQRLKKNNFTNISYENYDEAYYVYKNQEEFSKHISSMHGNLDYTLDKNKEALETLIKKNTKDARLTWRQDRYVFQATKL